MIAIPHIALQGVHFFAYAPPEFTRLMLAAEGVAFGPNNCAVRS